MLVEDVPARLAAAGGRVAGSDGERRAAMWLRDRLRADGERVTVRTLWVRPDWPLALGLNLTVAVAGSAVSVAAPAVGLGLLVLALVSLVGDLTGSLQLLRRLTPARATQNVFAGPGAGTLEAPRPGRLRLLLTANVDAGHTGAPYADGWVRFEAAARRRLRGRLPSVQGLLAIMIALLVAAAGARLGGASGPSLGAAQLIPTVLLLVALAMLVDVVLSPPSPGANANGSGVAAALSVFSELRRSPPRNLDVELLLAGAGEGTGLGLRAALLEWRRHGWQSDQAAVLAIGPCGVGSARYLTHDGPLIALRLHPQMVLCARAAAAADPLLGARPHRGHGNGAPWVARRRRWPTMGVEALDEHDRPGAAHQPQDTADRVDQRAIADCVELCLGVVEQLDRGLSAARRI